MVLCCLFLSLRTTNIILWKLNTMADDVSDYLEYYGQWCEQDAGEYANKAVLDYYCRIFEYLEQNSDSSDTFWIQKTPFLLK